MNETEKIEKNYEQRIIERNKINMKEGIKRYIGETSDDERNGENRKGL